MDRAFNKARQAIEIRYEGLCSIYEYMEIEDEDTRETLHEKVLVYEDIPCRLSRKTINNVSSSDINNTIKYEPVLYTNPDIEIKAGSKIFVTQHGVTREYRRSGEPFLYKTHQEIVLQRIDRA
ncbi:MAG: ABC transporter ATP-binding protein [Epulopiscium sp.]|nr:ABC transporter ATP-binding protein [Candidatus Epulonipiscium sp.]